MSWVLLLSLQRWKRLNRQWAFLQMLTSPPPSPVQGSSGYGSFLHGPQTSWVGFVAWSTGRAGTHFWKSSNEPISPGAPRSADPPAPGGWTRSKAGRGDSIYMAVAGKQLQKPGE